jgi:hypothetical protein
MFRRVRKWWAGGRGKITARLFIFEFVVVMSGVLTAQALQNWVAHRSAVAAMDETRVRTIHEQSANLAAVRAWQAAIPCLDSRMQSIMRAAAKGPIDPSMLERPKFADFIQSQIDDQSELLMRARYGNRLVDGYEGMRSNVEFARSNVGTIVHSWGRLTLSDSRLGGMSEADRSVVRTAAADIRAELRGLGYALADFMAAADRSSVTIPDEARTRPARACDEIWRSQSVAVPR